MNKNKRPIENTSGNIHSNTSSDHVLKKLPVFEESTPSNNVILSDNFDSTNPIESIYVEMSKMVKCINALDAKLSELSANVEHIKNDVGLIKKILNSTTNPTIVESPGICRDTTPFDRLYTLICDLLVNCVSDRRDSSVKINGQELIPGEQRNHKYVKGIQPNIKNMVNSLKLLDCDAQSSFEEVLHNLAIQLNDTEVTDDVDTKDTKFFDSLQKMSEKDFQELVTSAVGIDQIKYALDTHTTSGQVPINMLKKNISHESTATAIPDISCLICPQYVEYKNHKGTAPENSKLTNHDIEVLIQAIERVYATASTNETLKFVASYGTTGAYSWIVVLTRKLNTNNNDKNKIKETYHIMNIKSSSIRRLWNFFNFKALETPLFFIDSDWFIIMNLLKQINMNAGYCGITLNIASLKSASRLYNISLPFTTDRSSENS